MSHRRTFAALLLCALPIVSACGAGRNTETDKERTSPYQGQANAGDIAVRGVRIVLASGAPTASASPSAQPGAAPTAYVLAAVVNHGRTSDTLTSATVNGSAVQPTAASSTSFTVPPGQLVRFGDPDLGDVGTALAVGVLASPPAAGTTARVTLTFQNAGTVTIDAPVVDGAYAGTTATSAPVAAGG